MQKCPVHSCLFYYRYAFYSVNLLEKSRYASKIVWKKLNVPSTILPFSSIRFATFPIYASGCCKVGTFKKTSDCRRWWFAPKPPIPPGDAVTTKPGL